MKSPDNIEKLFKETFEHFEADVNPQVWTNVQAGINYGVGSAASTAAKFVIGKIIAGTAAMAVVAGSVWYFASSEDKTNSQSSDKQNKTEIASNPGKSEQNTFLENQSAGNLSNTNANKQNISSFHHYLNKNSADNSLQTENISSSSNNATATDNATSENTANNSSQPEHKYGRSSDAPTSMIRGNQRQNTNSNPLKDNSSDDVEEEETAPSANIFASMESGDAPLIVTFSNRGVASSLSWDFGDGSASRENSPSHTFDIPGTYIVKLIAKNSNGSSSDQVTIEVTPVSEITNIPNIFTPNGDGENDMFFFELKNIASIGVVIFNQKDGNVRSWNTLDGNWNGRLPNGKDAPEGVYLYSIQAIGTDGVLHTKKGSVTLNRAF